MASPPTLNAFIVSLETTTNIATSIQATIPVNFNGNTNVTIENVNYVGPGPDPFPSGIIGTFSSNPINISIAPNVSAGVHVLSFTLTGSDEIPPLPTRVIYEAVLLCYPPDITIDTSSPGPNLILPFLPPGTTALIDFPFDPAFTFNNVTGEITVTNISQFTTPGTTPTLFSYSYTNNVAGGNNVVNVIVIHSSNEPTPQRPYAGGNYLTFLTGYTHNITVNNHPGMIYNSSTQIELDFQGNVPGPLTPYLADTHNGNTPPNYVEVNITPGSVPDLYLSVPFVLNKILPVPGAGTTTENLNILILNNAPIDYDNAAPVQDNIILPTGINPNLIFTFSSLPTGVSYLNRTLSFDKSLINATYPISLPYTALDNTVTYNIYFEGTYTVQQIDTGPTGPNGPPTPPTFVGGNFSMEVCANTKGDLQKTIFTGKSTQRETLFGALVSLLAIIIRKRGIEDYKEPPTPTSSAILDEYFNSEALSPTYTYTQRLDAFKLFMKTHTPPVVYTPSESKIIDDTVKTYFKMMQSFILKFYSNNSVTEGDCFSSTEKPGFTTSASDCFSNIKLSISQL